MLGFGVDILGGVFKALGAVINVALFPMRLLIRGITAVVDAIGGVLKKLSNINPLNWFKSNKKDEDKEKEKPKLAKGGIVSKATELIAGEAGPEAIIPIDNLKNMLVSEMRSVLSPGRPSKNITGLQDILVKMVTGKTSTPSTEVDKSAQSKILSKDPSKEEESSRGKQTQVTSEKMFHQLEKLNTTMDHLLVYAKRTADATKGTHDSTKNLSGNWFAH